jgi:NAD(P)-dependent dehydrogenase (short-subunit alcohol dehydrogenase family)
VKDLKGKLALVTGAGSGIGRATAKLLAERGARLIVCDVDEAALAAVAADLGSALVLARPIDVGDRQAMRVFADEVHRQAPAVDVLVNNAGVGQSGGILDTSLDDWDWCLRVNLGGVIHGCHFFVPKMVTAGGGHVVNVASGLGLVAAPHVVAYAASKFGVVGLSESMRAELAGSRVGVSVVCPGFIKTRILERTRFAGEATRAERRKDRTQAMFAQRAKGPEVVAKAIHEAIVKNRAVVPVNAEVWAGWLLKRFAPPGLMEPVARWGARRTFSE